MTRRGPIRGWERKARWLGGAARVASSLLLVATGYVLLVESPFAQRLRDDLPRLVPGLTSTEGIALLIALLTGLLPLVSRRRRLRLYLASAFMLSGVFAYRWTLLAWEEWITETNFNAQGPLGPEVFALAALPVVLLAFELALTRPTSLLADHGQRGVESGDAARAARASAAAGVGLVVLGVVLAGLLWLFLSTLPRSA